MTCTVVVCTRNRPEALDRCLAALARQTHPDFDVLVVDNAPADDRAVAAARRQGARYLVEPAAGLSRARNTGARACASDVVAFIDDDAVPDPSWLAHLAAGFGDPAVAVVTGRTLPLDHAGATAAADEGDLGPRRLRLDRTHPRWFEMASFGGIGVGNNMAFRRLVFADWRGFDERLGRGAMLPGGEEHRAFVDLVEGGHTILYVPDAIVRHTPGRQGRVRARAELLAYALFLFLTTRHRWRVAKYVAEGIFGKRRAWRTGAGR